MKLTERQNFISRMAALFQHTKDCPGAALTLASKKDHEGGETLFGILCHGCNSLKPLPPGESEGAWEMAWKLMYRSRRAERRIASVVAPKG